MLNKLKKQLNKTKKKSLFSKDLTSLNIEDIRKKGDPLFITGCGRSGTHFMGKLFQDNDSIDAYHLDTFNDPVGEAFEFYSRWYKLPLNHQGYIRSRAYLINRAAQKNSIYIESNPMMVLSIKELSKAFNGKVIIIIRNPIKVVESHFRKGWYENISNYSKEITGYSYSFDKTNHYFSRIEPLDEEEKSYWYSLSRLGKIAWMWRSIYEDVLSNMDNIKNIQWFQIENFDYETYVKLVENLNGFNSAKILSKKKFESIRNNRPGKGVSTKNVQWDAEDIRQFNFEVEKLICRLKKHPNLAIDTSYWLIK